MSTVVRLCLLIGLVRGSGTTVLQTAAAAAGCNLVKIMFLGTLAVRFPTKNVTLSSQALADADLSRLPSAPPPPLPGVLETLLQRGRVWQAVPESEFVVIPVPVADVESDSPHAFPKYCRPVRGSGEGRLPMLAALLGLAPRIMAVEKEPCFTQSVVAVLAGGRAAVDASVGAMKIEAGDNVDRDPGCADRAAKGDPPADQTQSTRLQWKDLEAKWWFTDGRAPPGSPKRGQFDGGDLGHRGRGPWVPVGPVAVGGAASSRLQDGPRGPDRKEVAAWHNTARVTGISISPQSLKGWLCGPPRSAKASLAMKLESELPPGAVVWSLDRLQLQGAKVQETSGGKTSAVPAGGLVFLRRLHLNVAWSSDVPCHIYIRVPPPPPALRPTWPLTVEEAKRLHQASSKIQRGIVIHGLGAAVAELVQLGAMRLSGAVLSEGRFATAAGAYGAGPAPGRRLARAFGAQPLGAIPGWRCHGHGWWRLVEDHMSSCS
eukprot:Skav214115  [mRNA]  locus=scaffold1185:385909:391725:- [translate_table: standard]